MNPVIRNILAAIAGIIIGNLVNGGLIFISGAVIPPPLGWLGGKLAEMKIRK
jgi:hypothetical protein